MKTQKSAKKALSLLLSFLMIISAVVVPLSLSAFALDNAHGQNHTVSDYQTANASLVNKYLGGYAVPFDGTNGTPDLCVPGLDSTDDMIPQGFTYFKQKNWILISSYSNKGEASVIYALDFATGELVAQYEVYEDTALTTPSTAHIGGIAASENVLYVAVSGSDIGFIPLSELTEGTKKIAVVDRVSVGSIINNSNTSYTSFADGVLWTGNFYTTSTSAAASNRIAANGSYNSMVVGYEVSGSDAVSEWNAFKAMATNNSASYIIPIPNADLKEVQCATVSDGKLYLGTSYGRTKVSGFYSYDVNLSAAPSVSLTVNGSTTKGYALSGKVKQDYIPMTEGMFALDGAIYNIFESAAWKYNGGESSVSLDPTDVVWKIDVNAMNNIDIPVQDSDAETNVPTAVNSGLSVELVASSLGEPVSRVMYQSSINKISTVYYAKKNDDGSLLTNDSYYQKDCFFVKAVNHSTSDITVNGISAVISNGTGELVINGADNAAVLKPGQSKLYKVTMPSTAVAGVYNFDANYTMDALISEGSASQTQDALTSVRIVNEPSAEGSTGNFARYYNSNSEIKVLSMVGWNSSKTYVYPTVRSLVTYNSPADISRNMDKNTGFSSFSVNEPSTVSSSNIDSSGEAVWSTKKRQATIYYNINGAKYTKLQDTGIVWNIGAWKKSANQLFCHNTWTEGFGTSTSKTSLKQYPAINTNYDDFNSDVSNATLLGSSDTTKTTYLYNNNLGFDYGILNAANEIHAWNTDSRRATRVQGSVDVKINYFNASELATLFNTCVNTSFVSGRYNSDLWNTYKLALQDAANNIGAYGKTQEEINTAYSNLETAYNSLLSADASVYSAQVYEILNKLYTGRTNSGTVDKAVSEYYLVTNGEKFTPAYIDDSVEEGYTLSLENKIDARKAAEITAVANSGGVNTTNSVDYYANEYNVVFKNYDNAEIKSIKVAYGQTPAYEGSAPAKAESNTAHYIFNGWDKAFEPITGDVDFVAQYTAENHSFTNYVSNNDATCTANGTETAKCDNCSAIDTKEIADSALDHNFVWVTDTEATCGTAGAKHEACTRCDAVRSENTVIPATGEHSFTNYVSNDDATCTANGTETAKCDNCSATDTKEIADSALDHNFVWVTDTEATCGTAGAKHEACTRCDAVRSENTVIPATGEHSFTNYVSNDDATCTANGTETAKCDNCSATDTKEIADSALDHNFVWVTDTEATCGTAGAKHEACTRCDAVRSENTVIPATGEHSFTNYVSNDDATCTANGTETAKCDNCSATDTKEIADSALDHNFVWVTDAEATCGTAGAKHEACTRCDAVRSENTVIPATGHNGGTADCKDKAICEICGAEYGEIDANNHKSVVIDPAVSATCTKTGLTEGKHCSACRETLVAQIETKKLEHVPEVIPEKKATCTEIGLTEGSKCSVCGNTLVAQTVIPALEHNYVVTADVQATCTADGYKTYTCTLCGGNNVEKGENATGHNYVITDKVDADCLNDGKVVYTCPACDDTYNETIKAPGSHSFVWVVDKEASCVANGTKHEKCSNCSTVRSEDTVIPATGVHKNVIVKDKKDATCTETGYTGDSYCKDCYQLVKSGSVIEKTAHKWDKGVVISEATETEQGQTLYTCSVCGETKVEYTPVVKPDNSKYPKCTNHVAGFCEVYDSSRNTPLGWLFNIIHQILHFFKK